MDEQNNNEEEISFDFAEFERNGFIVVPDARETFINELLEVAKIVPSADVDFFLHATCSNSDNPTSQAQSIMNDGIHLSRANGSRILSTLKLVNKNAGYASEALEYNYADAKCTMLVAIPREIEGLFLGSIDRNPRLFGSGNPYSCSGNQNENHSILDLLELKAVPPQFIVGGLCKHGDEVVFVANPKFYAYKSANNVDKLKKIIEERCNEQGNLKSTFRMFFGFDEYNEEKMAWIDRTKARNLHFYTILNDKREEVDYQRQNADKK